MWKNALAPGGDATRKPGRPETASPARIHFCDASDHRKSDEIKTPPLRLRRPYYRFQFEFRAAILAQKSGR